MISERHQKEDSVMKSRDISGSVVVVGLAVLLASAIPASATWMIAHGNAAQIAASAHFNTVMHLDNGLAGIVTPATATWIQIPVPSFGDLGVMVRKIKVSFFTGADTSVTSIRVSNGKTKVKEFTGTWTGTNDLKLDMGSLIAFPKGLNISVTVQTGSAASGVLLHEVDIEYAGANFIVP
jgi:hypothetical protein